MWICLLTGQVTSLFGCSAPPQFGSWELPTEVTFTEKSDHFLVQNPRCDRYEHGLVFYPGGLVSPGAYVPLTARVAQACHRVLIAKMPLDLAVLNPGLGRQLKAQYVVTRGWVIGGHSLGGAMAARQTADFKGLFLLAAYADENSNLQNSSLPVISISASRDGLSTPAEIEAGKVFLPDDATHVEIEGGNHAQFGDYGPQNRDLNATISADEQQTRTATALLNWLKAL